MIDPVVHFAIADSWGRHLARLEAAAYRADARAFVAIGLPPEDVSSLVTTAILLELEADALCPIEWPQ